MSGAFIYRVTLTSRQPRTGAPHFVNFECAAPSMDDLAAMLNEGRLVKGQALITRKSEEPGLFEVVERRKFYLARQGVAHIEPPLFGFIEYEEAAHVG